MAHSKPATTRPNFTTFVRYTFRTRAASVSPRNVSAIEHMLRTGRRQVAALEDEAVRDCFVSNEMLRWETERRQARG